MANNIGSFQSDKKGQEPNKPDSALVDKQTIAFKEAL